MIQPTQPDVLELERKLLVGFCARYTGDAHAAEDLAQQALLRAWQHEQQLRDPQARRGWLLGIARNQCLMWARKRNRELRRSVEFEHAEGWESDPRFAGDLDLELEFERDELARLVERALALLAPDVRDVLVRRYVEQQPQAEVAAQLRTTEGAVEARLQRGKHALKRVLTTELGDEAAAHGIIAVEDVGWEETRIWCPNCARSRLEGWLRPAEGKLYMRCPECVQSEAHYIHAHLGDGLRDLRTYRPALGRVLDTIHDLFRLRGGSGTVPCPVCGRLLPLRRGDPPWVPVQYRNNQSIFVWCAQCEFGDSETWHSLTWSLPEARAFWREHPRMRFLPEREVEVAGSPAVVTGFESITGPARLDAVMLVDSLEVVSINGRAPDRPVVHG